MKAGDDDNRARRVLSINSDNLSESKIYVNL